MTVVVSCLHGYYVIVLVLLQQLQPYIITTMNNYNRMEVREDMVGEGLLLRIILLTE